MLRIARYATLAWTAIMVGLRLLFDDTKSQVVVIGLSITGYTYGALLGAFILGLVIKRADEVAAAIALIATVAVMAYVVLRLKITPSGARPVVGAEADPLKARPSRSPGTCRWASSSRWSWAAWCRWCARRRRHVPPGRRPTSRQRGGRATADRGTGGPRSDAGCARAKGLDLS